MPLELNFYDYDDQQIENYDFYWKGLDDSPEFKANYINGVKYLTLNISGTNQKDLLNDFKICFFETKWIMSSTVAVAFATFCLGHLSLTLYLLRKKGLIECGKSCCDIDDEYKKNSDRRIEDDEANEQILSLLFKSFLHNMDMISDWLYFLTVPTFNSTIKYLLIFFILLPIIPAMFFACT